MIKIYALINPRTSRPFYVGASKSSEKNILIRHLHRAKIEADAKRPRGNAGTFQRSHMINEILREGLVPTYAILAEVPLEDAANAELYYYQKLVAEGETLLQDNSRFYYGCNLLSLEDRAKVKNNDFNRKVEPKIMVSVYLAHEEIEELGGIEQVRGIMVNALRNKIDVNDAK